MSPLATDLDPHKSPENNWKNRTPLLDGTYKDGRTAVTPYPPLDYSAMADELKENLRLDPTDINDATLTDIMLQYKSPAFIAIDAGTYTSDGATMVVASAVLCVTDMRDKNIGDSFPFRHL